MTADACSRCHQLDAGSGDFTPLSFELACAGCHAGDLSMDPAAAGELVGFEAMSVAVGEERIREWQLNEHDFDEYDGEILKLELSHQDPWVLHNLRRLHSELDPAGFAAERAKLVARKARLERRLALASPTALEDELDLSNREQTLETELSHIEERLAEQATAADPVAGLGRLEEILAAADAAGDDAARDEARALVRAAAALRAQGVAAAPLPRESFEQSRSDLLSQLDVIESADPGRKAQIEAKQTALAALSSGCSICHEISAVGGMTPVAAAEPVLWRARFAHRDHLTQGEPCTSCHSGERGGQSWSIETSELSPELNFKGV